jgi:uncharacterized protein
MTRHRVCAIVLLLALTGAATTGRADDAAPDPTLHSNGSYLHSRLMPTQPQGQCPPNIDPVYQAYEIVTGTDMRQRPWGFAQTLREVLVKVSGDPRLRDDPRALAATDHAEQYVVCFAYVDLMAGTPIHDEQGTYDRPHKLTVTFDPAKIDALVISFGDKPWRGEHPVVVPVLLVHGRAPPPYVLSAENSEGVEQRGAFAGAASEFGLAVRFPSEAELGKWGTSVSHFPGDVDDTRKREAVVTGTLDWNDSLPGWVGTWRMRWQGKDHRWGVSGVNYDAAFRDIARGVVLLASGNGSPD